MRQLITEFNTEYPNYSASEKSDGEFYESENAGKAHTLQKLVIKEMDAYVIPNNIIKDATSIFSKANSNPILRKDNDGIFLKEKTGRKYIYFCELKSSFMEPNIVKAKDQIVGAYLKLHSLLSVLQSYNPDEWTIRGIIASYKPSMEKVSSLQRNIETDDKSRFCYNLQRDKVYTMPGKNCRKYFAPLKVPEITLYHIGIPDMTEEYEVRFDDIV